MSLQVDFTCKIAVKS